MQNELNNKDDDDLVNFFGLQSLKKQNGNPGKL